MNSITIDENGCLVVRCDPALRNVVNRVGGSWCAIRRAWVMPFTVLAVEKLIDSLPDLQVSGGVEKKMVEQMEREKKLEEIRRKSKENIPVVFKVPGVDISLYNYQKLGVLFALQCEHGMLLGDDMGLGKTVQAISVACSMKYKRGAKKCLIVTPASLKWNWPLEIEKFTNEKYVVIDGKPKDRVKQWLRDDVFFYIVNYELVVGDLFGGKNFEMKDDDDVATRARKKAQKDKALLRQKQLAAIRNTEWDCLFLDECFHPDTRIRLWNGEMVSLSKIVCNKMEVVVPAYNEERKCFEPRKVVGWFKNSVKQCYRVGTDGGIAYPSIEHNYMTEKGLRPIGELEVGDEILFFDKKGLSNLQLGALAGTLLGDTSLSFVRTGNGNKWWAKRARIVFTHGLCQKEYAEWKARIFGGEFSITTIENKGFGERSIAGRSKSIVTETDYCRFYSRGKKEVTDEWMDLLNPLGLALWIMDDGSVQTSNVSSCWQEKVRWLEEVESEKDNIQGMGWRKLQRYFGCTPSCAKLASKYLRDKSILVRYRNLSCRKTYLTLHTEGFPKYQVEIINRGLQRNWGIEGKIKNYSKGLKKYWIICFSKEESEKILKLIAPFVPQMMRYKLGFVEVEEYDLNLESEEFKIKERSRISKIHVFDKYKNPCQTYNIEVEGVHRYLAGDAIVANCHYIKNHSSRRTKAIKGLQSKFRMGLTGTPLDGRLEELHSLMEFIVPGLFESKHKFLQRHAEFDFWGRIKQYKKIDEVREKIQPFFIRRLKKDVLVDLPDKIYENRFVVLSQKERKAYNALAKRGHEATEDATAMETTLRCKQFCDHPELVDVEISQHSKLDAFLDVLDEIVVANGNKIIVFTQYTSMADLIKPELEKLKLKYLYLHGGTPSKDRAGMQDKFNTDPSIDVILGTDAMSLGLNLTGASYVVNFDDCWSPSIMTQREDRAFRIGQKNTVTVVNFICRDTIEERIRNVLYGKSSISTEVLGDDIDKAVLMRLGPAEVAKLL